MAGAPDCQAPCRRATASARGRARGLPMPRVSVVMPAYNAARHVGEAVRSVLAQRDADFELLVVDDGSTDGTAEALGGIRDPRLRLLRQENRGEGGARNAGLAATGGPLVAMTDADDL